MVTEEPAPPWRLAMLLGMLSAFAPLSIDMYLPALPRISADLGGSASHAQLTLTAFFLGLAGAQLVWGPVTDRIGRRRPVLIGLGVFALASLGCAMAPNIWVLMACRFLQACGGAAGIVAARAIVRDLFTGRNVAKMLSMQMLVMGVAPILAPMLGSALLGALGWRAIFGFLTFMGLACGIAAWRGLPETLPAAGAPAATAARPSPWAHYRLVLADRQFLAFTLASASISAGLFAYITASSFLFVVRHGLAPGHFAALFGVNAAGVIAVSQLNVRWLASHPPARLLRRAIGVFVAAAGFIFALGWAHADTAPVLAVGVFCVLAPVGAVGANAAALAMEHQRPRAGQASALMGTLQFALSAAASAAVGATNDGTARPLGAALLTCGLFAMAVSWRRAKALAR